MKRAWGRALLQSGSCESFDFFVTRITMPTAHSLAQLWQQHALITLTALWGWRCHIFCCPIYWKHLSTSCRYWPFAHKWGKMQKRGMRISDNKDIKRAHLLWLHLPNASYSVLPLHWKEGISDVGTGIGVVEEICMFTQSLTHSLALTLMQSRSSMCHMLLEIHPTPNSFIYSHILSWYWCNHKNTFSATCATNLV